MQQPPHLPAQQMPKQQPVQQPAARTATNARVMAQLRRQTDISNSTVIGSIPLYQYEENEDTQEFFVPFLWAVVRANNDAM